MYLCFMILRSKRVVVSDVRPATIHIRGEKIERVGEYDEPFDIDYGDLVILPGLVDSHVHVNEPGRTEWEGFETATRAAAAGGITTIVDMPLNSIPPTTSVRGLLAKAEAMSGKCFVDVGLWGGAVPGNAPELQAMLREGALGFKCFMVDSGVPEFGWLDRDGIANALAALKNTNAPLLVHAELGQHLHAMGDAHSYAAYAASRPAIAEDAAIDVIFDEVKRAGAKAHIVHLSSAGGLDRIRRARDQRLRLTAETTPHYLFFESEKIPDAQCAFKCAPPIRDAANRAKLWNGLDALQAVVSDHSPSTPDLKHLHDGNLEKAWGGIASLQFTLPIMNTLGLPLDRIAEMMCSGPADLAGIQKGRIAAGYDADLAVFDPDATFTVAPEIIEHRHKVTPYAGAELRGVVKATYLRGMKIWEHGSGVGKASGKWVRS
jgi:allantoinase